MNLGKLFSITLLFLFFSCNDGTAFDSEFDKSLDTWESTKSKEGNSYNYTVTFGSVFGFGSETVITIENDKVISRAYESYVYNGTDKEITDSWLEVQNELGTHEEGAEPITLNQIYSSCKSDILTVNEDENFITFLAENNGILSNCSYFPKNCQDDCSIGFNITSINWLN